MGADPPSSATNVVHRYIGALRRLLEPDLPPRASGRWLVRDGAAYRLKVDAEVSDLPRFRDLVRRARKAVEVGDTAAATADYAEALALWRGPCGAGVAVSAGRRYFAAIDRERSAVALGAADAALAARRPQEVLAGVRGAAAVDPLHERLQARLVTLLCAVGQQAEALRVYEDTRVRLKEALGSAPGPDLRDAYLRVLRQDQHPAREVREATAGPDEWYAPSRPAQLPADPPGFAGRESELAGLRRALDSAQPGTAALVAIDGMPGAGKTALAVHWAHLVADRFPDGQLYVDLRGFGPGDQVSPGAALFGFLRAMGVPTGQIPASVDARAGLYRSLLARRRVLAVLDNARDAQQVWDLLPGGPGCLAIVTSRRSLDDLVAANGAYLRTLDALSIEDARRALAGLVGAARVSACPMAVELILSHSAGLPLALAATAARLLADPRDSLAGVAAELRAKASILDVLRGGLCKSFNWSYYQLDAATARLFRLLPLHPEPEVTAPDAARLTGTSTREAGLRLGELARQHLVAETRPGSYRISELVREYAAELDRREIPRSAGLAGRIGVPTA
ncbi:BTAD domain-containing putative transcriptional regulator [Phytohabitans flavus]|uniref:AfsR/SARP family transcriptional regulator n=1 Tax=Phytohabitans flavus TaxID=1076124 RepID=UPI00362BA61D